MSEQSSGPGKSYQGATGDVGARRSAGYEWERAASQLLMDLVRARGLDLQLLHDLAEGQITMRTLRSMIGGRGAGRATVLRVAGALGISPVELGRLVREHLLAQFCQRPDGRSAPSLPVITVDVGRLAAADDHRARMAAGMLHAGLGSDGEVRVEPALVEVLSQRIGLDPLDCWQLLARVGIGCRAGCPGHDPRLVEVVG